MWRERGSLKCHWSRDRVSAGGPGKRQRVYDWVFPVVSEGLADLTIALRRVMSGRQRKFPYVGQVDVLVTAVAAVVLHDWQRHCHFRP